MENVIKHWINNSDPETSAELSALSSEELNDRFYKEIEFGTGGMRGIIGAGRNRINKYTVAKATQGYAEYIKSMGGENEGIVIAHDNRHYSRYFAEVSAGVLAANGIRSYLFEDLRTTPELSFSVRELKAFGGIVITASHNPPEYNGYKLYDRSGGQLVPSDIAPILSAMEKIDDELSIPVMPLSEAGELVKTVGEEIDRVYYERVLSLRFDKGQEYQDSLFPSARYGKHPRPLRAEGGGI